MLPIIRRIRKIAQPQNSIITKRSNIKATIEIMECKKIHDHKVQMENLQTTLTIKALAFIGYFTPSLYHNNSKSSSNTKPVSTITHRLFKHSVDKSKNKTDNHNVSSSASVKTFIYNIINGSFMKENYSFNNNNCQTFCDKALKYLKKISLNNEFYSPTYTSGNDNALHIVDIPLIQSHKAIRAAIDKIYSLPLLASDIFASIKRSMKSSKLKAIPQGITDIKAEADAKQEGGSYYKKKTRNNRRKNKRKTRRKKIRSIYKTRQHQLKQIQQTRRKHNRKHKNKKSPSRKHKNQHKNFKKNHKVNVASH